VDYPRYDPASPVTPLTPAEIDGLDRLLQALPADGVMSLDGVDGYLAALVLGPPELLGTLATDQWLPAVWGGDGEGGNEAAAPFASKRQRKATVVLLLRHLRHLAHQLATAPEAWEPIFSIAEQGADEWADARDWCAGFLQAVDLMPGAWRIDAAAEAWAPVLALGGGLDGQAAVPEDLREVDTLSRAVPEAVLQLLPAR
jgi:uncharacterized protein